MSNIFLGGASPPSWLRTWLPISIQWLILISISDFIFRSALQHVDTERLLLDMLRSAVPNYFMENMSLPVEIQLLLISEARKSFCSEFGTTKQSNPPLRKPSISDRIPPDERNHNIFFNGILTSGRKKSAIGWEPVYDIFGLHFSKANCWEPGFMLSSARYEYLVLSL